VSRVAIVTGGASGTGLATVRRLQALDVAVTSFALQGTHSVDVADERGVSEAVTEVRRRHGPIDILVNCAGVGAGGPLDSANYVEQWTRSLAVNLTGAMFATRACLPDLIASSAGRVINVASTEALGVGFILDRLRRPSVDRPPMRGFSSLALSSHCRTSHCVREYSSG
jgi:NAD(P)-dependent dehydrogenase (short-subunit alcohol dehydrogenase family)